MNGSSESFRQVWVHRSLRAAHQSKMRRAALKTGKIDAAFHYQSVRQAELWLAVHRRYAPVAVDPAFRNIFRYAASYAASCVAGRAVHVIGLGAGGGTKEALVLDALCAAGCRVRYTPVDVGLELALASARKAMPFVGNNVQPVVADLACLEPEGPWWSAIDRAEVRLFTAFGILPNLSPHKAVPMLGRFMERGDQLLVSANLAPLNSGIPPQQVAIAHREACEGVLPQYDNPETAAWLGRLLLEWGMETRLGPLHFGVEPLEGTQAVVARSEWLRDEEFSWEGRPLAVREGRSARVFFSVRYTPEILAEKFAAEELHVGRFFATPCGQEGVWHLEARGGGTE